MTSSSGSGNNNSHDDNTDYFVLENEGSTPPPNMDAWFMMLIEQMAKSNENQVAMQTQIKSLIASQDQVSPPAPGQPNAGTQLVI